MLPDSLLTCHVYAQFISLYRQLLTEAVLDEGRDSQDAGNLLFSSVYDAEKLPLNATRGKPQNMQRLSSLQIGYSQRGIECFAKRNLNLTTVMSSN